MVSIPVDVVGELCAEDAAAVDAWWAGLDADTAEALVASWAEARPAAWVEGDVTGAQAEADEQRREQAMWLTHLREYARNNPHRLVLARQPWRMFMPARRWARYRRFRNADHSPVIPHRFRFYAWRYSGGWRFL